MPPEIEPQPPEFPTSPDVSSDFWLSVLRGACGRCPRCGRGRLFLRYVKPVVTCAVCHEPLARIQTHDGPAWLTIVIVGHILAPLLLAIIPNSTWQDWVSMLVWPSLAFALGLLILPRSKGVFMGFIWHQEHKTTASRRETP